MITCYTSFHNCGGSCVSSNDPAHCGSSCSPCPTHANATASCPSGTCVYTCASGFVSDGAGNCTPAPPRPIAPISVSMTTSRTPTFKWALAAGTDGVHLDVCPTRACATFDWQADLTGSPTSYTMPGPLAAGVHFWRLYGRVGTTTGTVASALWEMATPPVSATGASTQGGAISDWNGDGYADAAVGSQVNYVWTFDSNASSLHTTPDTTVHGTANYYGQHIASVGDVNGDGYADLAVANYGQFNPTLEIHQGGSGGLSATALVTVTSTYAGGVSGAGDIDGDGYADVVALTTSGTIAYATVYYGAPGGFRGTTDSLLLDNQTGSSCVDGYNYSLTSGDFDGDGYSDVAIGAYWDCFSTSRSGAHVWIFRGAAVGIGTTASTTLTNPGLYQGFGSALGAADLNNDGYADVIVGTPGGYLGSSAAAAYAYLSSGSSGISAGTTPTTLTVSGVTSFGSAIADAGDVNGDGYHDLVIGAPNAQAAYLFAGGASGVSTTANRIAYPGNANNTGFGGAVAGLGDVNGDGYADVLIGASGTNEAGICSYGAAFLYAGQSAGAPTLTTTRNSTLCGPSTNGTFGISVALRELFRGALGWRHRL